MYIYLEPLPDTNTGQLPWDYIVTKLVETFSMKVVWTAPFGNVAEWSIALAWKASGCHSPTGSNPVVSVVNVLRGMI